MSVDAELQTASLSDGDAVPSIILADDDVDTDVCEPATSKRMLAGVFVCGIALIVFTFWSFPPLSPEDRAQLSFELSPAFVGKVVDVMLKYKDANFMAVFSGFVVLYLFLQTFAIPGAVFLSVAAGPLFGVWWGLLVVSCTSAVGSAMCYYLSYFMGGQMVKHLLPSYLAKFRRLVHTNRDNIFWYLLFLRVTPLLPNWFINVSSPMLNVDIVAFFLATFLGTMPANYIYLCTGQTMNEVRSFKAAFEPKVALTLLLLGCLALVPLLMKHHVARWLGMEGAEPAEGDGAVQLDAHDLDVIDVSDDDEQTVLLGERDAEIEDSVGKVRSRSSSGPRAAAIDIGHSPVSE